MLFSFLLFPLPSPLTGLILSVSLSLPPSLSGAEGLLQSMSCPSACLPPCHTHTHKYACTLHPHTFSVPGLVTYPETLNKLGHLSGPHAILGHCSPPLHIHKSPQLPKLSASPTSSEKLSLITQTISTFPSLSSYRATGFQRCRNLTVTQPRIFPTQTFGKLS